MDINERLENLRGQVPGCHVAAFVDLSSKMVLAVDSRSKQPQERLDALAERAECLLRAPSAICAGTASTTGIEFVVTPSHENTEVFVRSARDLTEALGLVCSIDTDIDLVLHHSDAMLAEIGEER